jgi:GDP-L-fucose synthase
MDTSVGVIDRESPVYVAGRRGLVGAALLRRFQAEDPTEVPVTVGSPELPGMGMAS